MIRKSSSWLMVLTIVGLYACNEKTQLDQSTLPVVDGINVFQEDTFTIKSTNVLRDSLQTSFVQAVVLGVCDYYPYVGPVTMDAAIQFKLPDEQFVFKGDNPMIDSVVLVMPYAEVYLDSLSSASTAQRFEIYQLDEPMDIDRLYYNVEDIAYGSTMLNRDASQSYDFMDYDDSVQVMGINRRPQMRIRMSDDFTTRLDNAPETAFKTSEDFINWFPGIFIKSVQSGSNSLGYFGVSSVGLEVYYHNDSDDSLRVVFPYFDGTCQHYTKISRTYDNTIMNTVNNPNPDGEEWTYTSYSPGIKTELEIPYLASLEDYIINDAIIEVIAEKNPNSGFATLNRLIPLVYTDTIPSATRDYEFELTVVDGSGYSLGTREDITLPNGEEAYRYRMRITRELSRATIQKQNLYLQLGGRELYGLLQYTPIAKYVTKLGGNNRTDDYRMKLKILYSKK